MIKKQNIQVLTLDKRQKHGKVDKIKDIGQVSDVRINEHAKNVVEHNFEGISNELNAVLHENPFLYNPTKADVKVTSIEDYFVETKVGEATLGSVFRSKDLKIEQKRKIIKKSFNDWKSDFIKTKDKVINKENNQLFVVGEVLTAKFSKINFIMLILLFIFISFMIFKNGILWSSFSDKQWLINIEQGINNSLALNWYNLVSTLTLYLIIIAYFYGKFHNYIIKDYMRLNSNVKINYQKYKKAIEKDFKLKFKNARKYYLKKNKANPLKVPPLAIERTATGKYDLEDVQTLVENFINETANLKRKKFLLSTFRIITLFLAYLGGLATISYLIYSVIINLF